MRCSSRRIRSAGGRYPLRGAAIGWSTDSAWSNPGRETGIYQERRQRQMRRIASAAVLSGSLFLVAILPGARLRGQAEPTLDATRRVLPEVGAGFRAVRRGPDGPYYVLVATTPATASKSSKSAAPSMLAVLVFDAQGRKLREIPAQPRPHETVSSSSLDVDAAGRVYVADAGGNAVIVYAADGT